MKYHKETNVLKASVLLITTIILLSTITVTANTKKELSLAQNTVYFSSKSNIMNAPVLTDEWLHYDDGTAVNAIGLTDGGTYEGAIRLTPTELSPYNGWTMPQMKFYHGFPGAPQVQHSGLIKIYGGGTATTPGALITSQAYTAPAGEGWVEVTLTTPVTIDASHDYWISVQVTHAAGEHPIAVDDGPAIDGKGDWVYAGGWIELQTVPLDYNWLIYSMVTDGGGEDTIPPVTTCALAGTLQGAHYTSDATVTLTATDSASGVNYTVYSIDYGMWTTYTTPFIVADDWRHTLRFYSVDIAGNQETMKYRNFTIRHTSENIDDWPMLSHDPLRSGYSTSMFAPYSNSTLFVQYISSSTALGGISIANGKGYVSTFNSHLTCFDAYNGTILFDLTHPAALISVPIIDGDRIYFGSYDDKIYCMNASTGATIWTKSTGNDVTSSGALVNGKLYFSGVNNKMMCLDTNGNWLWNYTTGDVTKSSPVVVDGYVFFGSFDNKVYCLNADTGAFVWNYLTGGDVDKALCAENGKIYATSTDNNLYCLNAVNGSLLWQFPITTPYSPAIYDGKIYIGSGVTTNTKF